ncbi:MAG: NUDIX hydrolase [Candidatus Krumholzibacteriota bacterium]|nr:NUDIX hydrolase [Candidatus Krumholzibacteriota bacterium]
MGRNFKYCPLCGVPLIQSADGERIRNRCPDCDFVHYRNPLPAAGVLVRDAEERVLLVKRRYQPFRGMWVVPSGYVEEDEDIRVAAARELREETGIEADIGPLQAVESCFDDPRAVSVLILFEGRVKGGKLRAGDDAEEVGFFPLPELPEIAFSCQRRILGRLRGKSIPEP